MGRAVKVLVNFNNQRNDITGNRVYRRSQLYVVTLSNGIDKFYVVKRYGRYYTVILMKDFNLGRETYHTYEDCTDEILRNTRGIIKYWRIENATLTQDELRYINWPI